MMTPVSQKMGPPGNPGRFNRLWRVLAARWPGAGWVILDHKAFPGPQERWGERALEHAPQLALYARLVAEASGRPVLGCFIHMPVVGRLLEIG